MQSFEKAIFQENLVELSQNTILENSLVLAALVSNEVINKVEWELIASKPGNTQQAIQLYTLLQTKVGILNIVLETLRTTRQSGAVAILENAHKQFYQNRQLRNIVDFESQGTPGHISGNIQELTESASLIGKKKRICSDTNSLTIRKVKKRLLHSVYIMISLGILSTLIYMVVTPTIKTETVVTFTPKEPEINTTEISVTESELVFTTITILKTTGIGTQNAELTRQMSLKKISEQQSKSPVTENALPKTTQTTTHPIFNETDFKCKLTVRAATYKEFVQKLNLANSSCVLHVHMYLASIIDWPQNFTSLPFRTNFENLTISGPFTALQMVNLLSQTPFLRHLHFKNDNDRLCLRNEGQLSMVHGIRMKVYLPMLRTLVIQNFTSCPELYEMLSTKFKFGQKMRNLVVLNGLIDNKNHFGFLELLKLVQWSLKRLILQNTSIATKIFLFEGGGDKMLIMPAMKHLRIDVKSNEKLEVGKKFCDIFPNLLSFTNEIGYFQYNTAGNILQCENLTEFSIGIEFSNTRKDFSVSFLKKYFPFLKKVFIRLQFSKCDTLGSREIVGWTNVAVPSLTVASNCRIFPVLPSDKETNNRTVSYTKANGLFVFNYNLQFN